MELERLLQLLSGDYGKLHAEIVDSREPSTYGDAKYEFDISGHKINNTALHRDKVIYIPDPLEAEDSGKTIPETVYVARLSIPLQKLIVRRAAAFLCGNPIELRSNAVTDIEKSLIEVIQKTWDDNKLDFESKKLAKIMMSEMEVAELWYTEDATPEFWADTPNSGKRYKLRMRILSNGDGDTLYPVYNQYGDMIAFARAYDIDLSEGRKEKHLDIYTDTLFYYGIQQGDTWQVTTEDNMVGKIPIIYYSQEAPEWADVQPLIERLENLISGHSDTNDYNGDPTTVVEGKVVGFSKKGQKGKVLEVEPGAKVNLMSWDAAPESIRMERDFLKALIHDMTDTPDISFEQMKSLGHYSGIALKMLFLGAHMKASDKEETFGKGVQRRVNYIKAAMGKINTALEKAMPLAIKAKFEYYLPNNDFEKIQMLNQAVGGQAIMSQETAVRQNPLIEDGDVEVDKVNEQAQSEMQPVV